jgi:hypothetical protein
MKKLLLFFFFSGSLDVFSQQLPEVGLPQNEYTLEVKPGTITWRHPVLSYDTIPATLLITRKPPSFGHSIDGYCIYQGGVCTGKHLKYWHKKWVVVGPEYDVWRCKRRAAK